jgi:hypothetical protein
VHDAVSLAFLGVTTHGVRRIGARLGQFPAPAPLAQEGAYLSPHPGANLQAVLAGVESARVRPESAPTMPAATSG